MQPFSPSVGFALVASAEKQAASPVVKPQAVVRVARSVRVVASATVGRRRGATPPRQNSCRLDSSVT